MLYICKLRTEIGFERYEEQLSRLIDNLLSTFSYLGPALISGSSITFTVKKEKDDDEYIWFKINCDPSEKPNILFSQDLTSPGLWDMKENIVIQYHLSLVANKIQSPIWPR